MSMKRKLLVNSRRCMTALCCLLVVLCSMLLVAGSHKSAVSVYAAEDGVTDFVSRLYTEILGRAADEGGLATWTNALKSGEFSGTEVAKGFIMSEEFLNKDMTNEEFVQILYRAFFGREADANGLQTWVDYLDQGYRKSYIFAGFANSGEFKTLCGTYEVEAGSVPVTISEQQPNLSEEEYNIWLFVERLYTEVLGRTPDMLGIQEWADYLRAGTYSGAEVSEGFIMSAEFQNKSMSNEEYVKIMYQAFFGREADEGGLVTWVDAMEDGCTKEYVFAGFANSAEFGVLCNNYGITQGEIAVPEITPTPTPGPTATPTPTQTPAYSWTENPDGTVTISKFNDTKATSAVVPSEIEGKKVTAIGTSAFSGRTKLTEIILPEGITNIGSFAFQNCKKLMEITIPEGVKYTNTATFSGCTELTKVKLPNSLISIDTSAFQGCSKLEEIEIPMGVTFIGVTAFQNCSSLSEINLPAGLTSLGVNVFQGCSSLTKIYIPAGVKKSNVNSSYNGYTYDSQEKNQFSDSVLLTEILVDPANEDYQSMEGVWFTKDGTTLIGVPCNYAKTSYEVPDGVVNLACEALKNCKQLENLTLPDSLITIGPYSLENCTKLTQLEIPNGVEIIGVSAFRYCNYLTELVLPDSVESIHDNAFYNCSRLKRIYVPESVTELGNNVFSKNTTIVTPAGSYAEEYAMENGIPVENP